MTLDVHATRAQSYLNAGYVVVEQDGVRVKLMDPVFSCLTLTGQGFCRLDKDHKGRHSVNVFNCDGCNKARAGRPRQVYMGNKYCFVCVKKLGRG